MKEELTFKDVVKLCKYIHQNTIDKTLNRAIEQKEIFYRTYEQLKN